MKEKSVLTLMVLLTIAFVVLKETNEIDWSWLWVLSPIWLPIVTVVVLLGLATVFALILSKE